MLEVGRENVVECMWRSTHFYEKAVGVGGAPLSLLPCSSSQANDRATQVKARQALEQVWLLATNSGIRLHPMNQILQLRKIKPK